MKKSVKILLAVLLVLVLGLGSIIAVPYFFYGIDIFDRSGWATSETGEIQYWDYYGDPLVQWQQIEGNWYYFDAESGNLVTGWLELEGQRYYLASDGIRQTGWLELEDGTYYLDPADAAMETGWQEIEDGTYYLDGDGRLVLGWADIDDGRYYLTGSGELITGWLSQEEGIYYLEEGIMATGWTETIDGLSYLGQDGLLCSGWTDTPEGRFFLSENGHISTGWTDTPEGRCYFDEDGFLATGWTETPEGTLYLDENGQCVTGWLDTDEGRYYLNESSMVTTGWLELDGIRYYLREDGIMAVGKVIIDEKAHYFTSTGAYVVLVNKWNAVPGDYELNLVSYNGWNVDSACYDALVSMLSDLSTVGSYKITSAYRSEATQQSLWYRRLNSYIEAGYSAETARAMVAQSVALPGTSEHHLGLAVDISAGTAVHTWLAENSWKYGFILRYPEGKTDITGIIHEPWHYRYVGEELAKELFDLGLCLEEYMDTLTEQAGYGAGTASNPNRVSE